MSFGIVTNVVLVSVATLLLLAFIIVASRRILGADLGIGRILFAGVLGLGAELGFESQVVWPSDSSNFALIPVQFGILVLVTIAILVLLEIVVPQGRVPAVHQWGKILRQSLSRGRRYTQLMRIVSRNGLIPFRIDNGKGLEAERKRIEQAANLRAACEQAGGAFIKFGQLLSTRSDLLPDAYLTELSLLQQEISPTPWEEISAVLDEELPGRVEDIFASIDHSPVATASIGQVHIATLASGDKVAVKVQRPGIVPLIERDSDIAMRLSRRLEGSSEWAREVGVSEVVSSMTASLREETDFRIEASNLRAMESAQNRHKPADRIRVPHCYRELCTKRVLVMEFMEGDTVSRPSALESLDAAARSALAETVFRSLLLQILEDGVFHSDLHPGNVIITPDGSPALLDLGSVGRIDSETRHRLADVFLAVSRRNSRAFADSLLAFVEIPPGVNEVELRKEIGAFMAHHLAPGSSMDPSALSEIFTILSLHGIALPAELMSALRAMGAAEGTLLKLDPSFNLLDSATEFGSATMKSRLEPKSVKESVENEVIESLPLLHGLVQRADTVTRALAEDRFSIGVRAMADEHDRRVYREFLHFAAITFLAGVFGIMAVLLLVSSTGPKVTETLTLFQLFGFILIPVSGTLTFRVLFDVFSSRRRH